MSNILYLTATRFRNLHYKKGKVITYSISLGVAFILSIISLVMLIADPNDAGTINTIIEFLNGIILGLCFSIITVIVFRGELSDNTIALEQRAGYKSNQIFLSRLIEILIGVSFVLLVLTIENVIIIAAANKINDIIWYRAFLQPLGWYAIILIITIGMTIFFASFGGMILSQLLSIFVLFVITLLGLLGGMIITSTDYSNPQSNYDQNSQKIEKEPGLLFEDVRNSQFRTIGENWDNTVDYHKGLNSFINSSSNFKDASANSQNYYGFSNEYYLYFGTDSLTIKGNDKFQSFASGRPYKFYLRLENYFKNSVDKYSFVDTQDVVNTISPTWDSSKDVSFDKIVNKMINDKSQNWTDDEKDILNVMKDYSSSAAISAIEQNLSNNISYSSNGRNNNVDLDLVRYNTPKPFAIFSYNFINWLDNAYNIDANSNNGDKNTGKTINEYRDHGHSTMLNFIYNPLFQYAGMFNGFNYNNSFVGDMYSSVGLSEFGGGPTSYSTNAYPNENHDNVIKPERKAYVEPVYVLYVVINALLILIGFFIYRKQIRN